MGKPDKNCFSYRDSFIRSWASPYFKILIKQLSNLTLIVTLSGFLPAAFANNYIPGHCTERKDNPKDSCEYVMGVGSIPFLTTLSQGNWQRFDCSNTHPGCTYPNTNLYDPRGPFYCWTADQMGFDMMCQVSSCPDHASGTPCTCDSGYKFDATGTSCVPNNLTITLSNGTTTEPGTGLPFLAMVSNESDGKPPQKPVTIKISLKVDSTSGGHVHGTSDRPRGGIANKATCPSDDTCWSQDIPAGMGVAVFNFNAPDASGTHTITATCEGCSNTETKSVDVKVDGLQPIPASPTLYALIDSKGDVIGAVKNVHADNHYLTKAAIGKLGNLAILYKTKVNSKIVLYLNDASLVWGGLFDVDIDNLWSTPHSSHDIGTSLDIRAQNSFPIKEGAVPITDFLKFITESKKNHFRVALHCKGSTQTSVCYGKLDNRHFHVDF